MSANPAKFFDVCERIHGGSSKLDLRKLGAAVKEGHQRKLSVEASLPSSFVLCETNTTTSNAFTASCGVRITQATSIKGLQRRQIEDLRWIGSTKHTPEEILFKRNILYHQTVTLMPKGSLSSLKSTHAVYLLRSMSTSEYHDKYPKTRKEYRPLRSYDEHVTETNALISLVRGCDDADMKEKRDLNDCFNALEDWMVFAKEAGAGIDAARQARRLLLALHENCAVVVQNKSNHENNPEQLRQQRATVFFPRASFYDVVLHAFSVCRGKRQAAEEAEEVLELMLEQCRAYYELFDAQLTDSGGQRHKGQAGLPIPPPEPTTKTFNIVIQAWAKSGSKEAGDHVKRIMQSMDEWTTLCQHIRGKDSSFPYSGCSPDERTIVAAIQALARSCKQTGPEQAFRLVAGIVDAKLNIKNELSQLNKFSGAKLDVAVFNSLIQEWVKSRRGRESAVKAEEILRLAVDFSESMNSDSSVAPNTRTYSIVIDAWAMVESVEKTGDGAQRAEDILGRMVRLYREGVNVKPNVISFTSCISAWAHCRSRNDAPDRAERLYRNLVDLFDETDDEDFKPDRASVNAVIAAWARAVKRPGSIDRAKELLEDSKRFGKPDLVSYNSILDGMAKRGMVKETSDLFDWLIKTNQDGDAEFGPDTYSYNINLSSLSRGMNLLDVEMLFSQMKSISKTNKNVKPNTISYTCVMNAWAGSKDDRRMQRLKELLCEMIDGYKAGDTDLKPDVFVLSVFLNACAGSIDLDSEGEELLNTAFEGFRLLGPKADDDVHIIYFKMISTIKQYVKNPKYRSRLLDKVFKRCTEAGILSEDRIAAMFSK